MIHHILVPVDCSCVTDALVEKAKECARAFNAEICLLHVEAEPESSRFSRGPEYEQDERAAKNACADYSHLNDIKDSISTGGLSAKAVILQGDVTEIILQEARQSKADLIIIGSHGHGALYHLLLGSVSEGVLREAPCPVMIVPSREDG